MDTATASLPNVQGEKLKGTVEDKVNEQYDSDASMAFYEHVMGGGGDDIHYGIFNSERDGLKESSQNSIDALAAMAEACGALKKVRARSALGARRLGFPLALWPFSPVAPVTQSAC